MYPIKSQRTGNDLLDISYINKYVVWSVCKGLTSMLAPLTNYLLLCKVLRLWLNAHVKYVFYLCQ